MKKYLNTTVMLVAASMLVAACNNNKRPSFKPGVPGEQKASDTLTIEINETAREEKNPKVTVQFVIKNKAAAANAAARNNDDLEITCAITKIPDALPNATACKSGDTFDLKEGQNQLVVNAKDKKDAKLSGTQNKTFSYKKEGTASDEGDDTDGTSETELNKFKVVFKTEKKPVRVNKAIVEFEVKENNEVRKADEIKIECKLNDVEVKDCKSGQEFTGLKAGENTLVVKATDKEDSKKNASEKFDILFQEATATTTTPAAPVEGAVTVPNPSATGSAIGTGSAPAPSATTTTAAPSAATTAVAPLTVPGTTPVVADPTSAEAAAQAAAAITGNSGTPAGIPAGRETQVTPDPTNRENVRAQRSSRTSTIDSGGGNTSGTSTVDSAGGNSTTAPGATVTSQVSNVRVGTTASPTQSRLAQEIESVWVTKIKRSSTWEINLSLTDKRGETRRFRGFNTSGLNGELNTDETVKVTCSDNATCSFMKFEIRTRGEEEVIKLAINMYDIQITESGGGADLSPLKDLGTVYNSWKPVTLREMSITGGNVHHFTISIDDLKGGLHLSGDLHQNRQYLRVGGSMKDMIDTSDDKPRVSIADKSSIRIDMRLNGSPAHLVFKPKSTLRGSSVKFNIKAN